MLGAVVVVIAFVAWADVTRAARLLNVPLALALAIASASLADVSLAARVSDVVAAALLIAVSIPRGPVHDRYGGADRFIV